MTVNSDKPHLWKSDIARSVDWYNAWFMEFAPKAYRETRMETTEKVEDALDRTGYLNNCTPEVLRENPHVLAILRMSTAPPLARDRLIGLAQVSQSLVNNMEKDLRLPPRMSSSQITSELERITNLISKLVDRDIFTWLDDAAKPTRIEVHRAATVVADRLCGAVANPIIRNAQERRQLKTIRAWLEGRGYVYTEGDQRLAFDRMQPGTFSFRLNVPIELQGRKPVNIPVDAVIMPSDSIPGDLPMLVEAKSAGDFTNTNKRRKEEAQKMSQLAHTYGEKIRFVLFLCGYFDSGYLGYEAAEGIDWVWEHRVSDLSAFGV